MKKNLFMFLSSIFFFGLLIIASCDREIENNTSNTVDNKKTTLSDALKWYQETELSNENSLQLLKGNNTIIKKTPRWDLIREKKFPSGMNFMYIPLDYGKDNSLGNLGYRNLVLYRNPENKLNAKIAEIITDDTITPVKDRYKNENFTGAIMIYDWKNGFERGIRIIKGQYKGEIKAKKLSDYNSNFINRKDDCYESYRDVFKGADGIWYAYIYFRCTLNYTFIFTNPVYFDEQTTCDFIALDILYGGTGSPGSTGGNTGEGKFTPSEDAPFYGGPDHKPINNFSQWKNCFDLYNYEDISSTYKITIFVRQPNINGTSDNTWSSNQLAGHAFAMFEKTTNGQTITQIIGFYPEGHASPTSPSGAGIISDDGGGLYNVSIQIPTNKEGFRNALNYYEICNWYDLNSFNCADAAISVAKMAGVEFSVPDETWIWGGGTCPQAMGNVIKSLPVNSNYNISSYNTYQKANSSHGPCL